MGHGNHWGAIEEPVDELIPKIIPEVLAKGQLSEPYPFKFQKENEKLKAFDALAAVMPSDTPLRYMVLLARENLKKGPKSFVFSAYPWCFEGTTNSLEVDKIEPWCNPIKGIIHANYQGAIVSFFDAEFYKNRTRYEVGKSYTFSLTPGLAYSLKKAKHETVIVDDPRRIAIERELVLKENPSADVSQIKSVKISLDGMCSLINSNKYPDDGSFRGVAREVTLIKVGSRSFYRLQITAIIVDDSPLDITIYASKSVLGKYRPKNGDNVEGTLWLQGRLV